MQSVDNETNFLNLTSDYSYLSLFCSMAGINKVILIGNLGKDPEIKYFENNIPKTSFSLATTENFKDKNGAKSEHTEWHNIVLWRTIAENAAKFLKKGMQVYIEGKLQTRQWSDKDGQKRNVTEVIAESFVILNNREKTDDNQNPPH